MSNNSAAPDSGPELRLLGNQSARVIAGNGQRGLQHELHGLVRQPGERRLPRPRLHAPLGEVLLCWNLSALSAARRARDPAEAGAAGAAGQRQRSGPADKTEAAGRLPGASEAQDPRLV